MNTGRRRWRGLVLLGGAVAGAHLLAIGGLAKALAPMPEPAVSGLQVRRIEAPALTSTEQPAPLATSPATSPATASMRPAAVARATEPVIAQALQPVAASAVEVAAAPAAAPASAPASAAAPAKGSSGPTLAIPPTVRWRYELRARSHGIELPGQAELEWRNDGQRYEARLTLRAPPVPTRTQRSTGRITPQGLAPERFSDRRRGEQAAHFDHERRRITFSNNRPTAELADGAQDRLSVLVQLGALLAAAGRERPPTISLQVAGTGDADRWEFHVGAEEDLKLPGGEVRALRLERLPRHEHDQRLELWLAPGWDYAPVRLRLTDSDGEWLEQQWSGTDRP